jgi:hypothetical protein
MISAEMAADHSLSVVCYTRDHRWTLAMADVHHGFHEVTYRTARKRLILLPGKKPPVSAEPAGKKSGTGEKQRASSEWCELSCDLSLWQEKAAESPGTQGKEEHTGCHEPERGAVVAHTTALVAYRPLWHGPSLATHGIHNPPKLDAVFGDGLKRRYPTLARTCLNCQEGNWAAGTVIAPHATACYTDDTSRKRCPGLLYASTVRP